MAIVKSKKIEKQEKSSVKLTVTISKANNKKEYDELLAKYSKDAHIKGFRKGKAPAAILERKFGEGIKQEVMMSLFDSSLKELFEKIEEKPLPYSQPTLQDEENIKLDLEKDFKFTVLYDIFPEVTLGEYKELSVEVPACSIAEKDIKKELEAIQERNAVVKEKANGTIAKDSIATINYAEIDDKDAEVEGTKREDFVFTVGTGQNIYKIDDDIIGVKKDEEKIIEKTYPENDENKDIAGKTVKIKIKVTAVKEKDIPKLDDELAQDVSDKYETLADLKKDLKGNLKKQMDSVLKQKTIDGIIEQLIEGSTIDVPNSMVNAELDNNWKNFLGQSRMQEESLLQILEMQGKSKEDLLEEWREKAVKSVKSQLIIGKLVEDEKIEVSDKDVDAEIKEQADQAGQTEEQVKEYFENNKLIDYLKSDIKNKKLFDILIGYSKVTKGKKVNFAELVQKPE